MSTENQVWLIGARRIEEADAAATISPGMLIEETSAGTFQAHSTSGGPTAPMFAEIDPLQSNTLDDDYSAADKVQALVMTKGGEVQAFLKAGENASIGDILMSAGDGTLIAHTGTNTPVAVAREAEDLSGSAAVATLIRVMLI